MAQTRLFPPVAKSLWPSREADLGLRARHGHQSNPVDRVPIQHDLGGDVRRVFSVPLLKDAWPA